MREQNYENRILRHRSLAAAGRPTNEQLQSLLPIVRRCVNKIKWRSAYIFDSMGVIARVTKAKAANCSTGTEELTPGIMAADQGPAADSIYGDGQFHLERTESSHLIEIKGTESLTPELYLDGILLDGNQIESIRDELAAGSATITAIEDEPRQLSEDEALALAYVALNPDLDPVIKGAAVRLCRDKYDIKYLPLRSNFEVIRARVLSKKMLPTNFGAANFRRPPRGLRSDFAAVKEQLRNQLLDSQSGPRRCRNCGHDLAPTEFSIKILREPGAQPRRAAFSAYCKSCKRKINEGRKLRS